MHVAPCYYGQPCYGRVKRTVSDRNDKGQNFPSYVKSVRFAHVVFRHAWRLALGPRESFTPSSKRAAMGILLRPHEYARLRPLLGYLVPKGKAS